MNATHANASQAELDKFGALASRWWDPQGPQRPLHELNPARLGYVRSRATLASARVLDVGCGGGLLAEAMARQGATVTGIDMVPEALAVARRHAAEADLRLDYQEGSAEEWAQAHPAAYDVVTCMELVEHVPDPASLVAACARLARPGGNIFFATVNRTLLAGLLVIGVAEYVLGIVRKGTHRYSKFVRPEELIAWGAAAGLSVSGLTGLRYLPFVGHARLCRSAGMNYMIHFKKDKIQDIT